MAALVTRTLIGMAAPAPIDSAQCPACAAAPLASRLQSLYTKVGAGPFRTTLYRNAEGSSRASLTTSAVLLIGTTLPIMARHMRSSRRAAVGTRTEIGLATFPLEMDIAGTLRT